MRAPHRAVLATALIAVAVAAIPTTPAYAGTGRGTGGQTLTVTPSSGVSRSGATVTVSGQGYDVSKGIYVAYCVDNGTGALPTPCGGGADTTGSLGASHWISSNPPAYAEGLPTPYGAGGSFQVTVQVTPTIGDVDCTVRTCVVTTRADHTRAADRSQDVRVAVTFATAAAPAKTSPAKTSSAPKAAPTPAPTTSAETAAGRSSPTPGTPAAATAAADGSPAAVAESGTAPALAGAAEPHVTRVSDVSSSGGGWTLGLATVGTAAVVLLGFGWWWRRRGATR